MMRRGAIFGSVLALVSGIFVLPFFDAALSQEKKDTGMLKVNLHGGTGGQIITTTVYREGQVLATRDQFLGNRVEFKNMPLGTLEVRCESPGHTTVIKRALLTPDDREPEVIVEMKKGEGAQSVGFGPSVHELEARIRKLEAAVAKLQGK